jgi:exopolysaccharide biosynthesis polyprenyl glycosylphosphotransferase
VAVAAALPFAWLAAASAIGAYDHRFLGAGTTEFRRLGRTFVALVAAIGFVSYAADLRIARGFVLVALPVALALTASGRLLLRQQLVRRRRAGTAMDRVVVVGRATSLPSLVETMRRDRAAGLEVVGACLPEDEAADDALRHALTGLGVPVLGSVHDVRDVAVRHAVDGIAVVAGDVPGPAIRSIAWGIESIGAELIVSSGLAEVAGQRVQVQAVGGAPLLRVDPPRFHSLRYHVKSAFDRLVAATAIAVLSPVLLALAALVRFTSHGPAFYFQERVGRYGKPFRMVKFRSMYVGADAHVDQLRDRNDNADGLLFKMRDDPRVTRVGKWLRRFSLDELPQLFNIAAGSMSLVGPRPPLPSEVALYEGDVRRRLLVKPGLTGLWQVSGRSDLSWEDSVRLDLHYVDNWSLALDLRLLARTAGVVVKATGAY